MSMNRLIGRLEESKKKQPTISNSDLRLIVREMARKVDGDYEISSKTPDIKLLVPRTKEKELEMDALIKKHKLENNVEIVFAASRGPDKVMVYTFYS